MPSSPGDLPNPGSKPFKSPALAGHFFITSATWEACKDVYLSVNYIFFLYIVMDFVIH